MSKFRIFANVYILYHIERSQKTIFKKTLLVEKVEKADLSPPPPKKKNNSQKKI